MGVGEWFSTFYNNISIKTDLAESISRRYKAITQRLNTDFRYTTSDTANSFYVGSYGRGTAIEGFSDLDMIYQLPYSYYVQYNNHQGNGQSALLQAVRNSILKTYSSSTAGADGQVVTVAFTDGLTYEVVPAFLNDNGSFTFPDANNGGSWKATDPKPEIEAIRQRNNECNGNLVPLCRMMRSWKSVWDVPMGGLLIDTLAYQFIIAWPHRDKSYLYYDFMSRDFFKYMADQDEKQWYWRAPGSSQYVWYKGLFQYKATRCYNLSVEAIDYAVANKEWSAKQTWREVFGTSFPN